MRERDYLTRTRKSPTVRIKINFSANAKCQSRARRREKSPAFFDHCTPDDNSALAIWKIPGISCLLGLQNPPQFFSLSLVDIWDNFYMHDLQLTIGTICKACESSEGSSIDRNLLVYSSGKSLFKRIKSNRAEIYFSLFRRKSPFKNAWCDAPVKEVQNPKLSLVIAQFVWHPIEACLWGLTRRRINRFKYGRFSIFHQGFSSEMSFTANYAHGRVQSQRQSINFKPQQQHWNNRLKPLLWRWNTWVQQRISTHLAENKSRAWVSPTACSAEFH